ncbi:MAG: rhomboid family intramembrane serine protease [Gammaproteobacteria bacterium]|nr:rhomboid family intramembrane serine protease [Gammaproteobacteria bacterium]MXZ28253.1 rhomboid family intramembrane serine protease [Gammaproteobacteria bacterium]MYF59928.1 rhomboid family intramembrane serine protease [Gammaproteobacteria bacterium]MYH33229.1 rhomboid family intramembrane serine protease [Gammaproteobacteria bacterium]MYL02530.1 rhomboid family intramembrane serine protease [Gammaproteobacteria bacterium]
MIPLSDENRTRRTPVVSYALLGAIVLAFLWQLQAGNAAVYAFGLIPARLVHGALLPPQLEWAPAWATVFTSMFLHGGWMHLGGNLLYLWIFGDNVEDALGRGRFVAFYLLCGVAAALVQTVSETTSIVPMIGASGAISGVLGAYLRLFPHAQVRVLVPLFIVFYTIRVPAWVVLGLWFLFQLASSAMIQPGQGGVAFFAHIGGFLSGLILVGLLMPRRKARL